MSVPPEDDPLPSKFWWVGYEWKRITHCCLCGLRTLAAHWFFKLLLPWVTGSYYAILDIWGDDWTWISAHKSAHEIAFWWCLGLSLSTQFIGGLVPEQSNLESDQVAREILGEFIEHVGAIVQAKLDRFRSKLGDIRGSSDKFKHITKPEEQIALIASAAARFLKRAYGFKEDQIDITILSKKGDGKWNYSFRLQQWKHNSPDWLVTRQSAAVQCVASGEPLFFPDKIKASMERHFVLSERDKRRGAGSAYVYPMVFEANSSTTECVVSIVTYGSQFCEEYDQNSRAITEAFLREICRRFEVELCLDMIKKI